MTTRYQKIILRLLMAILWRLIYKDFLKDVSFEETYKDQHLKIMDDAKRELNK